MRPAFLSTPRLRLAPHEAEDEAALAGMSWRLLSTGVSGDVVPLAALDAEDRLVGAARLEGIDWADRTATLALRWEGPPELARDAVALVVRYAWEELRLARVEARALEGDEAWLDVLAGAGFTRRERETLPGGTRVLRHDKAFAPGAG